jgi:protein TonB
MKLKKAPGANLEKNRGVYFIVGLIVSLSIVLISFEWTTRAEEPLISETVKEIDFESDMIQVTRREEPRPDPEVKQIFDKIKPVEDDIDMGEVDFSREVTKKTTYDFSFLPPVDGPEKVDDDIDFVLVEDMPLFNGGNPEVEFYKYVMQHLRYPAIAVENGVSGRVYVRFVVNKDGMIERVEVIRGVDPALDREARRVILSSPRWTPGKQRGIPVNVKYVFPINFVLQ